MSISSQPPALIVIAKEPRPGRSKTRLCPPCTHDQAARLAGAALADTLGAVAAARATRRVLVLDGAPGDWVPADFEVVPQLCGGLDRRLAGAFEAVGTPALLVGMDTPQLTAELIDRASATLMGDGVDAVLGLAPDGGYWAVGLRGSHPGLFEGVPMSTPVTGEAQRRRFESSGLRVEELPPLRDVDTFEVAIAVAAECPDSHFARAMAAVRGEHADEAQAVSAR